jgi:transcriptional regulator with XRE-family HTH domain
MRDRVRPSNEWYERKIYELLELPEIIGAPSTQAPEYVERGESLTMAFGTLIRLKRRESRLSVQQLASKLDVELEEIRNVEHDPHYRARPRTIILFAKFFDLPPSELIKLAGVVAVNDGVFQEKALKFAAHSDDVGGLDKDERELLNSFVRFLRDKA